MECRKLGVRYLVRLWSFAVLVLVLFANPIQARDADKRIATFRIDLATGKRTIVVNRGEEKFRAFRLRVKSGRVTLRKITMQFRKGRRSDTHQRFKLSRSGQTPYFGRFANGRVLGQITIEYEKQPGQSAVLELYGLPVAANSGWQPIARKAVPAPRRAFKRPNAQFGARQRRKAEGSAERRSAQQRTRSAARRATKERTGMQAKRERARAAAVARARRESAERRNAQQRTETTIRRAATERGRMQAERERARAAAEARARPEETARSAPSRPIDKPVASGRSSGPDCVRRKKCTPVRVFFGTNRACNDCRKGQDGRGVIFTGNRSSAGTIAEELTLGRAIVTVPAIKRQKGQLTQSGFFRKNLGKFFGIDPDGDPEKHFVIYKKGFRLFQSKQDFLDEVKDHINEAGRYKDHAFVFVHGYNTPFDLALMRTAQIAYDLGEVDANQKMTPFGTPFLFSWPSAGGTLFYAYDQESSRFAIEHFKHFLKIVIRETGAKKIHLIAHSMGNVALLNAMAGLSDWANGETLVEQVILASPDVDVFEFKRLAAKVRSLAKNFTMYASSKDLAMSASKQVHFGIPRAGDVVGSVPTIANGIHTIDISAMSNCYFCTGHNEYVDQPTLLNDITHLLRGGVRLLLPHERTRQLKLQSPRGSSRFWRYSPT
jgi:esterase/lipase superfamily enzyme